MSRLRLALVPLLLLAACEPPPVVPTADRRQRMDLARIEGSVVVQSTARGNVVVLLYDAAYPPPPQGAGRPLAFTLLSRAEVFGDALHPSHSGPFTARFTFDSVPAGSYLLRGFIDADTCLTGASPCHTSDWLPWYSVTAEPNLGDVGGAARDLSDPASPRDLVVEVREEVGADGRPRLLPAQGVAVTYGDAARLPVERPSFRVQLAPGDTPTLDTTSPRPKVLTLHAETVRAGPVQSAPRGLLLRYEALDGEGRPVDTNGDGVPEVWPKVVVRKLSGITATSLVEENDLDRDGVLDAAGVEYEPAAGTADGKPDRVVLAAGFHPDAVRAALNGPDDRPLTTPDGKPRTVEVSALPLLVAPRAYNVADAGRPVQLKAVPPGRYTLVLVQHTGQTWRLPNELDPRLAGAVGLPGVEGQDFTLQVPLGSD